MKLSLFGREVLSTESKIESPRKLRSIDSETPRGLNKIDAKLMRKIVTRETLLYKAITKKSKDTFTQWFKVLDVESGEAVDESTQRLLRIFDNKTQFVDVLVEALECAYIYGTGFIEKIYNEPSGNEPYMKVNDSYACIDLHVIDPENIVEYKKMDDNSDQRYFVHRGKNSGKDIYIHPSRLEVITVDKLPFTHFGLSKVSLLYNILKSKMNFDVSSGEYLNWFGMGLYDLTIENMSDEQEEAAYKELSKHKDFLVHDQDYALDVKSPSQLNPKEFIDYFYVNIASALEMPRQMLVGGDFTDIGGSDVGVSAYYSDVENTQRRLERHVVRIYEEMLRLFGKKEKLMLDWNEIFVDELSEAKIQQTRAYSVTQCKNAGIIDQEEARKMMNEGHIELDTKKKIEEPKEEMPKTSNPNTEPQPAIKRQAKFVDLTPIQREMIRREREIGEKELQEQEIRLYQALIQSGQNKLI